MTRLTLIVVVLAGCAHTQEAQSESREPEAEQHEGRKVATPRPVGTTPESIVRGDGIRQIQDKLGVQQSGVLDESTRAALMKFQRRHQLAATGLPDLQTVETLGLDTNDIFQSGSRKKEEDSAARKNVQQ